MPEIAENPVIRQTKATVRAGWLIREYADGHFDAAHAVTPALSPGFTSFREAVAWLKGQS